MGARSTRGRGEVGARSRSSNRRPAATSGTIARDGDLRAKLDSLRCRGGGPWALEGRGQQAGTTLETRNKQGGQGGLEARRRSMSARRGGEVKEGQHGVEPRRRSLSCMRNQAEEGPEERQGAAARRGEEGAGRGGEQEESSPEPTSSSQESRVDGLPAVGRRGRSMARVEPARARRSLSERRVEGPRWGASRGERSKTAAR